VLNEYEMKRALPYPVILVALCQFLKAGFLVFFALKISDYGAAFRPGNQQDVNEVILCIFVVVMIGAALYFIASGYQLLQLDKSARRRLMWNMVAGWLIFGTSMNGILFGQGPFVADWPTRILICVLILDAFLYCCLAFYPGVAEAFGEKDGSDLLP